MRGVTSFLIWGLIWAVALHQKRGDTATTKQVWSYGAMGYMTEHVDAHNEVTLITFCNDDLKAVTVRVRL